MFLMTSICWVGIDNFLSVEESKSLSHEKIMLMIGKWLKAALGQLGGWPLTKHVGDE